MESCLELNKSQLKTLKAPDNILPDFESLWNLKPLQKEERYVYGKLVTVPRWVRNFGAPYKYSKKTMASEPIPDILLPLFEFANQTQEEPFTEILVNFYENGQDSISMHSDDEICIKKHSPIFSLSMGQERTFHIKHKRLGDSWKIKLANGDIVIMAGEFQTHFLHGIPKENKCTGRRINITMRQIQC